MSKITVRRAIPSDAEALAALNEAFNGPNLANPGHIARSLAENDREIVCIAFVDGQPAGFCCAQVVYSMCYPDVSAEITEMYVAPEYRRMNIARSLIQQTEAFCACQGASELKLLTGDDNFAARKLYESCGYSLSGEVHYEKEISHVTPQ